MRFHSVQVRFTVSTAILAHSIFSTHELQHRVKVAADRLKAASEGVQPPVLALILCLGAAIRGWTRWRWCWFWVSSLLARSSEGQQAHQEGNEKAPACHPVARSAQCEQESGLLRGDTETGCVSWTLSRTWTCVVAKTACPLRFAYAVSGTRIAQHTCVTMKETDWNMTGETYFKYMSMLILIIHSYFLDKWSRFAHQSFAPWHQKLSYWLGVHTRRCDVLFYFFTIAILIYLGYLLYC